MRWQWGQVAHDDLSIVYGRVFPPADVADPERIPGFLGVLGAEGPLGFSTDGVDSRNERAGPTGSRIASSFKARGRSIDLDLDVRGGAAGAHRDVDDAAAASGRALDFLQLGGEYTVSGKVGDRALDFTARGAAETFRPR